MDFREPAHPDLLAETGYRYTLNWCHDDQPTRLHTRNGQGLWAVPYSQELNDIPMIVGRQMDGCDFARLIIDNFDEMLGQARQQPLVMGLALHPCIVGQPYRLRHLRRALARIARARDRARSGSPRQAPFAPTWIRWLDSSGGLRRCARAQTQRQRVTTVHGTC